MRYYIEIDGKVFLVKRNGSLDLPNEEEIPFPIEEIAPLATSVPVIFAVPKLPRFPRDWLGKDALASLPHVSSLVREAIHASMPRVVVEGIAVEGEEVLLVKANRGLTEGLWSLPGGFLRYGESPTDGLIREVGEELGVSARIEELIAVKAKLGEESHLHWIMLFYRITIDGELKPAPDEIAEAQFFPIKQAKNLLCDSLMRAVVASLIPQDNTKGVS